MNDRTINVANAIVAVLNGTPAQTAFGAAIPAVRDYIPLYDLTDLANLPGAAPIKITVVPKKLLTSPMSRKTVQELVAVDVAVQQKVPQDATARVAAGDALMELMEVIKLQLEPAGAIVLTDAPTDCGWQDTTPSDPLYDPDDLSTKSIFTTLATFTYLTRRAR